MITKGRCGGGVCRSGMRAAGRARIDCRSPGGDRDRDQHHQEHDRPHHVPGNVEHDDEHRCGDSHRCADPAHETAVAQEPPPAGESKSEADQAGDQDADALGAADDEHHYRRERSEKRQPGQPPLRRGHGLARADVRRGGPAAGTHRSSVISPASRIGVLPRLRGMRRVVSL